MTYYLITENIRDGENEYTARFIVKAKTIDEAEQLGKAEIISNYGGEEGNWDKEGDYLDLYERIIELDSVSEITKKEAEVLQRYFYIV